MTTTTGVSPAEAAGAADRVSAALRRRIALALLGVTALVYMLTAPGHLGTVDMRSEFAVAQSMVGKADFTVSPSLPYVIVNYVVGPDGEHYSDHGLGQSLLLVPAALVGRIAGCGDPASCPATAQHDAEFAASFVDGVAAAVAVMLMFLLALDMGAAVRPALALSLLFGFTTIEWAYAHDAFDVGPTATVLLLSLFAVHRGLRGSSARWLIVGGAAAGFAIALRLPSVVCVPIFATYVIASTWRLGAAALVRRVFAFGIPVAGVLLVLGWYNWIRFGDPLQSGVSLASDYIGFGSPLTGVAGLLFSPGRSIFLYSPILIAALAGVPLLWRRHRALTATVVAIVVVNLGFYGAYAIWWGAWNWGPRYLVPMTPFLILPLLPLLQRWGDLPRTARRAIYALVAAGVVVQLLDIGVDFQHQTLLLSEAGVNPPDAQSWTPQYSGIWRHGEAVLGLFNGSAVYPANFQFIDLSTALPLQTVLDVWWVYAWIDGVNPLVVITVLVGAVAGVVALARWLWRTINVRPSTGPLRRGWRSAGLLPREPLEGLDAIDAATGEHK
jgi:hypothetical protein